MIRKSKCGFIWDEFGCSKHSDYPLQNTARWILWTWNFREFCWVLWCNFSSILEWDRTSPFVWICFGTCFSIISKSMHLEYSRATFAKRIPTYYCKTHNQHPFSSANPKKDKHTQKHTSFPPDPSESKFHRVSKHAALQVAAPKHEVIKLSDLRPDVFFGFFGFRHVRAANQPPPERWSCECVF